MTVTSAASGAALVRRFYAEIWNRWDDALVDELLDAELVFRGSLGVRVRGRAGFRAYRDKIRAAFPDFHNELVEVVAYGERVAARLEYSGTCRGSVLGLPPTNRRVSYSGAAFFQLRAGRIARVWVLGDVDSLRRQLLQPAG
ncbi:ester cyclase [Carbonactinospora thermoautotrophica]|uniref:ester cyclase n=1 Tax=Carbonactinospora thermoautotrophica TaxID=1469144 RepID=UPI0008360825|nr:ester cyclase [Carbonactinospora thermoautotrophica]